MYLPQSIWTIIFEYDSTYHVLFENVLMELVTKNKYWRIQQTKPPPNLEEMNIFQMSYPEACELCNYWNKTFYEKYKLHAIGFLPTNSFYYPENISDVSDMYPIIDKKRKHKVYSLRNI